ncbi:MULTISPECIES: DUF305 domain-containing protein [unclassified Rhodococcus (in: high G+C Gram-positive bacteria)]|jgi:uncharacterized protein (DUF305 family)|uniref:DUF305 domain-containing protein n=1 Tax=unclassified Rhodococcus (in: high G+C Gram-positive bacteria) TaxID=192944 RepID=UPI0004853560|nr:MULTISPECIES: DUF305 domain-containing protein [unclassified Rhodococcus (in: high G+C Gram-positive bacteria)]MBY6678959.1 DUF305 domain-containing protein [Rhodococcus sp. BP-332]MBY6685509.1 DUF305 domain-containing protein [Rhodococcus sp. BP-288]MBY6694926.1 DUF305 domain-containing protein [Rhodococcus sp. BP-188]MBY6696789.1 DUF305 domain-containing protein [Rhodococcus sp. BP-285]MBY6703445.1 DUF305 domain-containing protein [Rhodococcus sp. BP-283]
MHVKNTTVTTLAAAAIGVALVAGCGDDGSSASMEGHSMGSSSMESAPSQDPAADFADADVAFASMMYPHHAQAVEMASMVDGRSTNPDVVTLADEIADAQGPEMDQLASWLAEWGQPSPSATPDDMQGMDHGSGSGMMSSQDMASLTALSGDEFDQRWLTMMIDHHRGAVAMAETEIEEGSNDDAVAMARTIVDTQNAEIARMEQLLG